MSRRHSETLGRGGGVVLMLLNTSGIQYDDRVRKECASLLRRGWTPMVCAVESANQARGWSDLGGTRVRSIALRTRSVFRQAKGLVFKVAEMYLSFAAQLLRVRPAVVWVHNVELAGFVPFCLMMRGLGLVKQVIWDQHELPSAGMFRWWWQRRIWNWLMWSCDGVVVAAAGRREWLEERTVGESKHRVVVLENFADEVFADLPLQALPDLVSAWVGDQGYWLAQGGGAPGRPLEPLVESVMVMQGHKLVVVGPVAPRTLARLEARFGSVLGTWVWFTGMVPQMEVARYIDHAVASVVLYSRDSDNNWWCAPNRLYQALSRGIPVVVGANPPMRRAVEETGAGVVLAGDGADADDVACALRTLDAARDGTRQKAMAARRRYLWESQDPVFDTMLQSVRGSGSETDGAR